MKRWCYRCGSPNQMENDSCSECGFAFNGKASPLLARSEDSEPDREPAVPTPTGLLRAALIAGTAGVWVGTIVIAATFLFFVSVAVIAFTR